MSVQNLISDFILEKTQEAPSEEKINAIVSNYGDNTDALINDLFMEFKGEAPAPDQLNQIKSTYLADQPVKKKKNLFQKWKLWVQNHLERKRLFHRNLQK